MTEWIVIEKIQAESNIINYVKKNMTGKSCKNERLA